MSEKGNTWGLGCRTRGAVPDEPAHTVSLFIEQLLVPKWMVLWRHQRAKRQPPLLWEASILELTLATVNIEVYASILTVIHREILFFL